MSRTLGRTWRVFALLAAVLACAWPVAAPAAASGGLSGVLVGTPIRSVYVRGPNGGAEPGQPLQVMLALHGMGGNGADFSRDLAEQADRYGWLLVAPTIDYGDWTSASVVAREEPLLIRTLLAYIDQLPQAIGAPVQPLVLVFGHSRGAQLAHRLAEFRPDRVLAVAALSAGTYTLPDIDDAQGGLTFPYGLNDLALYAGHPFDATRFDSVQFWVGVGGQDTNTADVPHQWDTFEGNTRLQRAQAFEAAMQQMGANSILRIFGDARHDLTSEMRQEACTFLGRATPPSIPSVDPLAAAPMSY
jgi:pimeloyl-ACP methyl ester carboxylesterase